MDTIINLGVSLVGAHPKFASWLVIILAADQVLKTLKNAFKLNIPDNIFDWIGDVINQIIAKSTLPKQ